MHLTQEFFKDKNTDIDFKIIVNHFLLSDILSFVLARWFSTRAILGMMLLNIHVTKHSTMYRTALTALNTQQSVI